jgi:hypothetical protein
MASLDHVTAPSGSEGLRLGPFLVAPDGAMCSRGDPTLRFAWRGRACEVRIRNGQIRLSAAAGAVPYSAEQPEDRPRAVATVLRLPAELPSGWRLNVLPDHRLLLATEMPLREPTTAATLVGAMVQFALGLDPYLDLLETAGVAG